MQGTDMHRPGHPCATAGILHAVRMQQGRDWPSALMPLPDAQFTALRLWAMNFGTTRAVGVAVWPFGYTQAQKDRLQAMVHATPQGRWLFWILIFAIIWFAVGILILFVAILPLAATLSRNANPPGAIIALLMVGIVANMLSAYTLGSVIASWIAGRILNALLPLPALEQADGDAELLEKIRRQTVKIAILGGLSAGLSILAPILAFLA